MADTETAGIEPLPGPNLNPTPQTQSETESTQESYSYDVHRTLYRGNRIWGPGDHTNSREHEPEVWDWLINSGLITPTAHFTIEE